MKRDLPQIIRHEILDPENNEPMVECFVNLDAVAHAKKIPGGPAQVTLKNSVTFEEDSPNQSSQFWARVFWEKLKGACPPITESTETTGSHIINTNIVQLSKDGVKVNAASTSNIGDSHVSSEEDHSKKNVNRKARR